jgi:hypothetical protein
MSTDVLPIDPEFATPDEAEAHAAWFRRRVQASLDDTRPAVPHDQAMARIAEVIAEAAARQRHSHET